jgi:hypothetical protein
MNLTNHDLRAFLNEVEKIGELRRIENIPWDKDIGGLVEMILERSAQVPPNLNHQLQKLGLSTLFASPPKSVGL